MPFDFQTVSWPDQELAKHDDHHRIYLCEYGHVHLIWEPENLPYCPGDFMGLPFLLLGLEADCNNQCEFGAACVCQDPDNQIVSLQYGSIHIALTPDECRQLNTLVQEAARKLQKILHLDTSSDNNHLI